MKVITNLDRIHVQPAGALRGVPTCCSALLVEPPDPTLPRGASKARLRGFGMDCKTAVFEFYLDDESFSVRDYRNEREVPEGSEQEPPAGGRLWLLFGDGTRALLDLERSMTGVRIDDCEDFSEVWPTMERRVAEFRGERDATSDLPPWAPRQLFCKKVAGLVVCAEERDEAPVLVLERGSNPRARHGDGRADLSFQAAHRLAEKLARAIDVATGQEGRTRESVFLDPDPGEISIYADAGLVVVYLGPGEVVPNLKADDPDAQLLASEVAGSGSYPVTVELKELAALTVEDAGEVSETLAAALAALD